MIPSQTTRIRHLPGKAIVTSVVALMMVAVTYEGQVGRNLGTEGGKNDLTLGTVYAQEGEGPDIGAGLDIVGGLSSFLYYAFDKSYIDKFYGGNVGGFILNFLLSGGDTEGVELDYIINQLSMINQKLNHVISLELQIENELRALAREVNIDTTKGEINTVVTAMTTAICNIEQYMGGPCFPQEDNFLLKYASLTPKKITPEDVNTIVTTCKSILEPDALDTWLTIIHAQMMGPGQNSGFINLAAIEVQEKVIAGQSAYQEYQVLEGYFLKYILIQSRGINLYMNCARALPVSFNDPTIKSQYLTYLGNIVGQFEAFRNAVEETVVLASNQTIVREAFNPSSGSTTWMDIPQGSNNILPRVDFVIDQALGGTNFEAMNAEMENNSAAFLNNPRGALTARVLSAGGQNLTGYELNFTYAGPIDNAPSIPGCPNDKGLQRTKVWTLANAGTERFIITSLAGYQGKPTPWTENPAMPNTYLGSSSYQLAVSTISLDPGEVGSVGLCASGRGAKEKDGSLYLAYHLLPPGTQTPGPTETIGWAGTGTVGTSEYTPDRFTVDEKTHTITIKGNPYNSAGTGTASAFSGTPYLQWTGSTITGNDNTFNLIRYDFPNVPLGGYEVTGPSGGSLLPENGEGVYLYDRQFSLISSSSGEKGMVLATSQSLRSWEIFTLEIHQTSQKQPDSLIGTLQAANKKYLEWDTQQNRLVANSDTGQNISFIDAINTAKASGIITWRYLQIGDAYVQVNTTSQQIALVEDKQQATKFKMTFIDKGKAPLEEGKSYKVSLAYGVVDDDSPVKCPSLVPFQNNEPQSCFQYYLFANIGYPYGYFTYSPVEVSGAFGKSLGQEAGGSPFDSWTFTETSNVVEGCPENGGKASSGAYRDKPGVWGKITSKSHFGESCVSAGVMAANVSTIKMDPKTKECEYHFTMSINAGYSADFQWNGQDDHEKLTHTNLFLRLDRGDRSKNPWPSATVKELSTDVKGSTPQPDNWNTSGDLSFSSASELSILYGLYLAYNDQGLYMSVYPTFNLKIFQPDIELHLTGISGNNCQIGPN